MLAPCDDAAEVDAGFGRQLFVRLPGRLFALRLSYAEQKMFGKDDPVEISAAILIARAEGATHLHPKSGH